MITTKLSTGQLIRSMLTKQDQNLSIQVMVGGDTSKSDFDPMLVLVCMDQYIAADHQCVASVRAFACRNINIIPLILKGFTVVNYSHWWPRSMPAFENHKLFVDLRSSQATKVEHELLPQIYKYLEEWRGGYSRSGAGASKGEHRRSSIIPCTYCISDGCEKLCTFDRQECLGRFNMWQAEALDCLKVNPSAGTRSDNPKVRCDNQHEHDLSALLSTSVIFHALPCPMCLEKCFVPPHMFDREALITFFNDEDQNRAAVINCPICSSHGLAGFIRVMDILHPQIFTSYNWGYQKCTQDLIKPIIKKIEMETDLLCWFDVSGGMGAGQDHLAEMQAGIEQCAVVIVFLSDSYVNSLNCKREFSCAVHNRKYIIPILVPALASDPSEDYSSGWTGSSISQDHEQSSDWWMHAVRVCTDRRDPHESGREIPWSVLSEFSPIDLRKGWVQDRMEASASFQEIICRIMSRFHRSRESIPKFGTFFEITDEIAIENSELITFSEGQNGSSSAQIAVDDCDLRESDLQPDNLSFPEISSMLAVMSEGVL